MPTDSNEQIWDLLRNIQKKMREHLYQTFQKYGFSVQEALLIRELVYYPNITLNELSKRLGLSKSTVSSMVCRMEEQGIILREIPQTNRRIVQLKVSPEYSNRPEVIEIRSKLAESLVKNMTSDDARIILEGLTKLDALMV